jgi:ADP-ribosylglycohydrolase
VTVEQLGGGWVAEEALAIAVYAALAYPEPEQFLDALALSVTHSGDSDSTGAICGNILGALHGETALPPELVFTVEGRAVILELADDFALEFTRPTRLHGDYGPHTAWGMDRYPGW